MDPDTQTPSTARSTPTLHDVHPAMGYVRRLTDAGYTPDQIVTLMDGRVTQRTVYRWGNGGSDPQNPLTLAKLEKLADRLAPPALVAAAS